MAARQLGFIGRGADFWNLDPRELAEHDEDVAELIERAQSAIAIAVAEEDWSNVGPYECKRLPPVTLFLRRELARAWVTADKVGVQCFDVELSVDGGKTFRDVFNFVPEEFRP